MAFLKKIIVFVRGYRYYCKQKREALNALKNIENSSGKKLQNKAEIEDYAKEIFGSKKYAPWLYVYSMSDKRGFEKHIPDNYYGDTIVKNLKGGYGRLSDLKPLNKKIFRSDLFPDLGSYINNLFFDSNYIVLSPERVKSYLFKEEDKIVFKVDESNKGTGVYVFDKEDFDIKRIKNLGNGVFQSFIRQHDFFNQFHAKSVATIRVTTYINEDGIVNVLAAYLRLAVGDKNIVLASNAIKINVNKESGRLDAKGYLPSWRFVLEHPDTNVEFEGLEIPEWGKIIGSVVELHEQIPFVRCVGWDLVINKNNQVKVMEWNGKHNGIKFSEFATGPIFKDVFEELMRTH